MVPFTTAMIPLFQIFAKMKLIDTRMCLILIYVSTSISFSVFLTSGYMKSVPDEILDAAVIDGCGTHGLLFRIVIPLIKNAIITNLVIQFFFKWNDLMAAMTFVSWVWKDFRSVTELRLNPVWDAVNVKSAWKGIITFANM